MRRKLPIPSKKEKREDKKVKERQLCRMLRSKRGNEMYQNSENYKLVKSDIGEQKIAKLDFDKLEYKLEPRNVTSVS